MVYVAVNGRFRYVSAFDAAVVLKLSENSRGRHAGIVFLQVENLLLKVVIKFPWLTFIDASLRNECIKTTATVVPVPSFNRGGCKVFECAVRSKGSFFEASR